MNYYCRKQGLDEAMDAPTANKNILDGLISAPMIQGDYMAPATAAVATHKTGDARKVMEAIRAYDPEFADRLDSFVPELWDSLDGEPQFSDAVRIAQAVKDFVDPPEPPEEESQGEGEGEEDEGAESQSMGGEEEEGESQEGEENGQSLETGEGEDSRPVNLQSDPMDKAVDDALEAANGKTGEISPDDALMANKITKKVLPLTRKLHVRKLRGRSYIASDAGRVPRNMGRYCTDKAIFNDRGKRKIVGGTILIDCSTHMGIDSDALNRLMEIAPTANIATYRGCWFASCGTLHIIAQDGKRTEENHNLVPDDPSCDCAGAADVPLLEWLGAQQGPLFWVGKDPEDQEYKEKAALTFAKREALERKHKVRRFESLDVLITAIRSGK